MHMRMYIYIHMGDSRRERWYICKNITKISRRFLFFGIEPKKKTFLNFSERRRRIQLHSHRNKLLRELGGLRSKLLRELGGNAYDQSFYGSWGAYDQSFYGTWCKARQPTQHLHFEKMVSGRMAPGVHWRLTYSMHVACMVPGVHRPLGRYI